MPKVVILAAGEGRRLRPYTLDRPKCMVEVNGRSLLDRQLDVLRGAGATDILLVGGYRADRLAGTGTPICLNPRFAETNMVWSLFAAEDHLTGEVVVAYGDIVYSPRVLQAVLAATADIAVAIDLDWEQYWRARAEDPLADAETLKLSAAGRILEIGQKPRSLSEIEGQYMGLLKFSATGIDTLRRAFLTGRSAGIRGKPAEKAFMTDLLQQLIDDGVHLQSVPVHGGWVEVDTVDDLHSPVTAARLAAIAADVEA